MREGNDRGSKSSAACEFNASHTYGSQLDMARGVPFTHQRAVASKSLPVVSIRPAQGWVVGEVPSPPGMTGSPHTCQIRHANKSSGADGLSDPVAMGTAVRWKRIKKGSYKKKAVFKTLTLSPPILHVSMEAER